MEQPQFDGGNASDAFDGTRQEHREFGHGPCCRMSLDANSTEQGCVFPTHLNLTEKCAFVRSHAADCEAGSLVNYTQLYFCSGQDGSDTVQVLLLVAFLLLLLAYFTALSVAADSFFCPCLQVIVKHLKISQNIAGVTFLAFGNGAPDIFSSIASVFGTDKPKVGLAFGALAGAGVYLTTFVTALVVLQGSFSVMRRPMLRDLLFFLLAVLLSMMIVLSRKISYWESAGFLSLYALYCVVVVVGRYIRLRMLERDRRKLAVTPTDQTVLPTPTHTPPGESSSTTRVIPSRSPSPAVVVVAAADSPSDARGAHINRTCSPVHSVQSEDSGSIVSLRPPSSSSSPSRSVSPNAPVNDEPDEPSTEPTTWQFPNYSRHFQHHIHDDYSDDELNEFDDDDVRLVDSGWYTVAYGRELLFSLKPFSHTHWREGGTFGRTLLVAQAPLIVLFKLTIPSVDPDMRNQNWFKSLALCQCFTCPMLILFTTRQLGDWIADGVPVAAVVLCASCLLAALVWYSTSRRVAPKYYLLVTYLGFVMSVVWIYAIANEVVGVISFIGAVSQVSDAVLGLTLLAWSNSLGDTISDLSVARQGYPRMAISACFGGPLLNLLVGIGVPFLLASIRLHEPISMSQQQVTGLLLLMAFLVFSLVSSLLLIPIQKFNLGRPYAFYLLVLYAVFLVTNLLYEFHVIDLPMLTA